MVARSGLFVAPVPGTPPTGTAPTDARLALAGITGVIPQVADGGGLTQSSSALTVTVAATTWLLADPTNTLASFLSPTDLTVLTIAAGPATGSRIDSIAVKQNNFENGDADSRANVILVPGTASATPVAPPLAAGYFRYANIAVPASASTAAACTITNFSPTNIAPLNLTAPTAALLRLFTGSSGQFATVTADSSVWQWAGTVWVQISKPGSQPFATAAASGSNVASSYTTVTFPTGRFSVAPIVTAMTTGGIAGIVNVGSISATQMTIAAFPSSGSSIAASWYWTAVQMTATSASG
jgi:hypothetical protein